MSQRMFAVTALICFALAWTRPAAAQRVQPPAWQTSALQLARAPSGGNAFLIEGAGAAIGSAAGFLAMYAVAKSECDVEDLGCIIAGVAGAGVASTLGAAAGAFIAGRAGDTNPSLPGALLGAVVGSFAGFGMFHVLTEEVNVVSGDVAVISIYVLTQSALTALGSRIARSL